MTVVNELQEVMKHRDVSEGERKRKPSNFRKKYKDKYFRAPLEIRMQRSIMTVSLNPKALKAFTISGPTFVAIGIVRWEQEFGLLTIDSNGNYVRVNGSCKELLDPDDVKAAIFRASQNWDKAPDYEVHLNEVPLDPHRDFSDYGALLASVKPEIAKQVSNTFSFILNLPFKRNLLHPPDALSIETSH